MSCPEIVNLYNAIRTDTNVKMGQYVAKLQSRYGDPRAYQAQQQEMRREEAAILFDSGRRKEVYLQDAYRAQVEKNRKAHAVRFKSHAPAQSTPPESRVTVRRSRTPKQTPPVPSAHPPAPDAP